MIQNNPPPFSAILHDIVQENSPEKIHVAVEKSFKKTLSSLDWCFKHQRGAELCLLHVHQPSPFIPTILGKLPASKANGQVLAAHRATEIETMRKLMKKYLLITRMAKMEASFIITESEDYYKGVVDLVAENFVKKLVISGTADTCLKRKSSNAATRLPHFCEIMYIDRGRLIRTKEATYNHAFLARSMSYSDSVEDECASFIEAEVVAEVLRAKAQEGDLQIRDLKTLVLNVAETVKLVEREYEKEVSRRNEAEDALNISVRYQEKLLTEKDKIAAELQDAKQNIEVSKIRFQEACGTRDEATKKLMEVQTLISSLHDEAKEIKKENTEINRWVESWRKNTKSKPETFVDAVELPEFSLADLQTATSDFSDDFRISRDEYGSTFKGEMLGRTVIIKKLHGDSVHSSVKFEEKARLVGRLRHRHLATVLGFSTAATAIVYQYVPGCNLHNLLKKPDLVPWSTRTRVIAQIANVLLYIHSSTVHGNLQPGNIALDNELQCKVYGQGICNLLNDDVFLGSSFRRTDSRDAFPYTAPELLRTNVSTAKSDLYSLGVIILQLLTKRSPLVVNEVRKAVFGGTLLQELDESAGEWPAYVARRLADLGLQLCESNGEDRPELTSELLEELERLSFAVGRAVPPYFVCPILKEIMYDPMIAADGQTYEGEAIRKWFKMGHDSSPLTNLPLEHLHLTPNHMLRLAVQTWFYESKLK